ncbi:hypothetical protein Pmani_023091 [Petrolisthes manimaculis]|uniref:Solute carrier family 43 member 3 n=1 Tax=Petrolisthes manimaculis TaxID=1843537 RepID=A0AAE1PCM4_9EUCA|nr:hypothetical protein Pmani_023091 [Petrolisthes manimaculis]
MLLSVGGNMIRMAALQLADLFPTSNTTALAIISGIYTPSAAVMMLLQVVYEAGVTWHHCCWLLALAASLVVVFTPLFPRHHVPYARPYGENNDDGEVRHEEEGGGGGGGGGGGDVDREDRNNENEQEQEEEEEEEEEMKDEAQWSLKESVLSISSLLYLYWMSCNLFCVTLFGTYFNAWINKFANTKEERKSGVMARVARIQSMISPMVVVSLSVTTQISMLLLRSPWAVYVGLVALIVNRPSILAVGNPFVRVRYPAEHFNRLQGFQGTTVALITLTQYPHFIWAQQSYTLAMSVMLGAMVLSLVQPLHLLCRQYLIRVLTPPPEAAILRSPLLRHAG